MRNFANPSVDTQTWYVAARSRDVVAGRIHSREMLHRRIALYRDSAGRAHAIDARCPHLGADLGQADIVDDTVRCAFHHWRFDATGTCVQAPGISPAPNRCTRVYPVEERWGLVWLFNGPAPLFPLPDVPDSGRYRIVRPKPQIIHCHPHLVVGNGLDLAHLEALHDMHFTAPPRWSSDGRLDVSSTVTGRPKNAWLRWITNSRHRDIVATFKCTGANLALATIDQPIRFHALFTGKPLPDGGCETQVILFLPRGLRVVPALILMGVLLHKDNAVLERLQFTGAFAETDAPLRSLAAVVDGMPVW